MKGLLFTYLMTYGGALVSLVEPFYGLLVYLCFARMKPEALWPWSVPAGNYSRTVAIALLIGWALRGFGGWRFGRSGPMVLAMIVFWSWSLFWVPMSGVSVVASKFADDMTKIFLPLFVGVTLIENPRQLKQLAWTILLTEGYLAFELNLSYLGGVHEPVEGFLGVDNNTNGIMLATGFGMAFFAGFGERNIRLRALAMALLIFLVHAILFSFSRGGMLGMAVAGLVGFLILPKTFSNCALFAIVALVGLRLAGPEVMEEFGTTFADDIVEEESAGDRLILWGYALDAMREHPLGLGPEGFPIFVFEERDFWRKSSAHNTWMQVGAELGLPGLGSLLAFFGTCLWGMWRIIRGRLAVPDPWCQTGARMVMTSLVGFMVSGSFVTVYAMELPYYVAILGAGLLKLSRD